MHFLIVSLGIHPDVAGGAWRVAAEQAAGLARRGHTVEVITAFQGGARPLNEVRDGYRIWRYPQPARHFFLNWRDENRAAAVLIRQCLAGSNEPVLLVQHHPYLEPAVSTAPVRVLHTYHGPWADEFAFHARAVDIGSCRRLLNALIRRGMRRVERRALRRAERIMVLSRHVASRLRRFHGIREDRIEVAPGGADFTRFRPLSDRAKVRQAFGLSERDSLLLAVRRLDPRMGLELLVDAFGKVGNEFPRAHLWIGGVGPCASALERRMQALDMGARLRLLGRIAEDELPRLLNAADVVLMPSHGLEGFGLVSVEALACGTPVMGSRGGATPEVLEPLSAELLFEPALPAIIECLRRALDRPGVLPSRANCAAYARQCFSWAQHIEACERIARGAGVMARASARCEAVAATEPTTMGSRRPG
jgi:glycosyltransferase involved in cell wall biosynthesis